MPRWAIRGAAALADSDCLDCHSDKTLTTTNAAGVAKSLFVDPAILSASVHKTNACISCHADLTAKHPDDNRPVHRWIARVATRRRAQVTAPASTGWRARRATPDAATCADCHGSHDILPPTSPASPLHFVRQAQTCGQCHPQEARDVAASVHGKAMATGKRDAPTCTDCHSEHKIEALKDGSPLEISDVCSRCHASVYLDQKYNLPADRVKTYLESYHGLAAQNGSTVVANCASCHGYHKILPSSDPDSTINTNHLVATCGQCHPGANTMFVSGKIHEDISAHRQRARPGRADQPLGAADLSGADLRRGRRDVRPQRAVVSQKSRGASARQRAARAAHEPVATLAARRARVEFHHAGRDRVRPEISRFRAGGNAGFKRAGSPLDPSHRRRRAAAGRRVSPDLSCCRQRKDGGWCAIFSR